LKKKFIHSYFSSILFYLKMENYRDEAVKEMVREKYAEVATQTRAHNAASCCGVGATCADTAYNIFAEDYSHLEGYVAEADLALGCGIPTEYANILPGMTVLDLGSGAGNDVFVARRLVGTEGKVIGVDMTDEMLELARNNADRLGYNNVEFRKGDIESLPVAANRIDVVISNCVLNLVPNKQKAFDEIFRVLKPGGRFCISDVVLEGELPEKIRAAAEMYAGCVAGAMQKNDYLNVIDHAGFDAVEIKKTKPIVIPDEILQTYGATNSELPLIESITVVGVKPNTCCPPGAC
jgi:SAM-dependent methyltransferase